MNIKNNLGISGIPFKDKKQLVDKMCIMYKKLQKIREFMQNKKQLNASHFLSDIVKENDLSSLNVISMFDTAFSLLPEEQSLVLQEEFLNKNENREWYQDHWSKSTFYKIKHDAIDQFIYLIFA